MTVLPGPLLLGSKVGCSARSLRIGEHCEAASPQFYFALAGMYSTAFDEWHLYRFMKQKFVAAYVELHRTEGLLYDAMPVFRIIVNPLPRRTADP